MVKGGYNVLFKDTAHWEDKIIANYKEIIMNYGDCISY